MYKFGFVILCAISPGTLQRDRFEDGGNSRPGNFGNLESGDFRVVDYFALFRNSFSKRFGVN